MLRLLIFFSVPGCFLWRITVWTYFRSDLPISCQMHYSSLFSSPCVCFCHQKHPSHSGSSSFSNNLSILMSLSILIRFGSEWAWKYSPFYVNSVCIMSFPYNKVCVFRTWFSVFLVPHFFVCQIGHCFRKSNLLFYQCRMTLPSTCLWNCAITK